MDLDLAKIITTTAQLEDLGRVITAILLVDLVKVIIIQLEDLGRVITAIPQVDLVKIVTVIQLEDLDLARIIIILLLDLAKITIMYLHDLMNLKHLLALL